MHFCLWVKRDRYEIPPSLPAVSCEPSVAMIGALDVTVTDSKEERSMMMAGIEEAISSVLCK